MKLRRRHYRKACLLVVAVVAGTAVALAWWWRPEVDLSAWRAGPPPTPWAAWRRQEAKWTEEGSKRRIEHNYVPLGRISTELQLAVLVGEDIDYLGHGAIDPSAVCEAIHEWLLGRRLRGASTLTQQLAKILFLSQERSLHRKLVEARLAFWLERELGKRRILELYLNAVEFGPGLLGADAAARHYFGVDASSLGGAQAAALAAAIPAPGRDNPSTGSRRWGARRDVILRRMGRVAWLRQRLLSLDEQ